MDSTTIKRAKPSKKEKKNTVTVNSVILYVSWLFLFIYFYQDLWKPGKPTSPDLACLLCCFAYVASLISCFVVRDLCSISRRFRVLSNPHLPPSLARRCFSAPVRNLLSWTKVTVIWNQKPKAGFGAVPQFKLRYWSPRQNFPGEHHVKLWDGTKLIRFADII